MPDGLPTSRGLERRERLRSEREVKEVLSRGRRLRGKGLVLLFLPNGLPHPRLAVVAGRQVGKAVRRNRAKRLMREAYRLNKQLLRTPCDLVFIALSLRPEAKMQDVAAEVQGLLGKANERLAGG